MTDEGLAQLARELKAAARWPTQRGARRVGEGLQRELAVAQEDDALHGASSLPPG